MAVLDSAAEGSMCHQLRFAGHGSFSRPELRLWTSVSRLSRHRNIRLILGRVSAILRVEELGFLEAPV